jgi:hypothetical protein
MSTATETLAADAKMVPIEGELARRGIHPKGKTERCGPCPKCGGDDRFSINTQKGVWNCRNCSKGGDVIALVQHLDGVDFITACETLTGKRRANGHANGHTHNAPPPKPVEVEWHEYPDEHGVVRFAVKRIEYQNADGSFVLKDGKRQKTFRQMRPDPDRPGQWINNLESVDTAIPYRLPELLKAVDRGEPIVIVEGERKADLLWSWGIAATTNAMGAGKWTPAHSKYLNGADVLIPPDNDEPGRQHAESVAASLQDIAHNVRILDLPGLGPKGDIVDWADRGGDRQQLNELIAKARHWRPKEEHYEPDADGRAQFTEAARPLTHFEDFNKVLELDWIVRGLFARGHNSYLFGPPGGGKSAMLGSVATYLGAGAPAWHGFKIKQPCAAVYFALERAQLVQKRVWAESEREGFGKIPLAVSAGIIGLMDPQCVKTIVGTILRAEDDLGKEVSFVVLDTFGKAIAAGGGDENQARDQNLAWGHIRMVHEVMARWHGIHIAAIGHTGKDESRGARGSNAADGDNDISLQIRDEKHTKSVTIHKANEMPTGPLMQFRMEPRNTGRVDEDGEPIEVWIVAPDEIVATSPTQRQTKGQRKFQDAFDETILSVAQRITPRAGMDTVMAVRVSDVRREFYRLYVTGEDGADGADAKRMAFKRTLDGLSDREFGACAIDGTDWIWRVNHQPAGSRKG